MRYTLFYSFEAIARIWSIHALLRCLTNESSMPLTLSDGGPDKSLAALEGMLCNLQ